MNKLYKLLIADWEKVSNKKETILQYSEGVYFFAALIAHITLLVYYLLFADYFFVLLNVNSIMLNVACLMINRHKRTNLTMLASSAEVMIYGVVSVCLMGWEYGFQWYAVIAILPYYCFVYIGKTSKAVITAAAVIALYFSYFYSITHNHMEINGNYSILCFINVNIILIAIFFEIRISDIAHMISRKHIEKLETDVNQDPMTGLWNRRYAESFFEFGNESIKNFCVALIDIDHFKKVNDTYGHDAGDKVLMEFSQFLMNRIRSTDTVIRWGGEEILVILNQVELQRAYKIMDALREEASENVYLVNGHEIRFTITIGLVESEAGKSPNDIIRESDECMYFGKKNGRNQIVTKDIMAG